MKLSVCVALFAVSLPAEAIIIRHDVTDAAYRVDEADYPALVDLLAPGDCIGTLVEASHLLTVAHCAAELEGGHVLDVAGQARGVAAVAIHPDWRDGDRYDIAVVRLDAPVDHVDPLPIHRGEVALGQVVELVGRGMTGTGIDGEDGGFDDARLRRATNTVVEVDDFLLGVEMNAPGDASVTALEGVGAAGDSGCPVFVEVGGTVWIVGLNAFGETDAGIAFGAYGAYDYQTRVAPFAGWIDGVVGGEPDGEAFSQGSGCSTTGGGAPDTMWVFAALMLARQLSRKERRRSGARPD